MKTLIAAATVAIAFASSAYAQSPQIPTPANPYPANPIGTDGAPLPRHNVELQSGRSVFTPVTDVVTSAGTVFTAR